ncbi:hypothetical protein NDN08_007749 [Rhodosorus marinus]|uniref:Uncharacterized protein n=1 Tax=Rhodosorus marinus TaxID=101924 RepID=A0AAV8UYF3_9RHOD|nr:hypothetical protein NDN08_007749 [Rhodosorus marinus]
MKSSVMRVVGRASTGSGAIDREAGYGGQENGEFKDGEGIRERLIEILRDGSELPSGCEWDRLGFALGRVISGEEEFRPVYEGFPRLMLKIFGFGDEGWLEDASRVESKEREAVLKVLLPTGPLHRLVCATAPEYTFEFPVSNLPLSTQNDINTIRQQHPIPGSESDRTNEDPYLIQNGKYLPHVSAGVLGDRDPSQANSSLLSWFCLMRLSSSGSLLTLSCYEYFLLCMCSSPLWRGRSGSSGMNVRRRRRSSLLPSRRAVFNYLFSSYANFFAPKDQRDRAGQGPAYGRLFLAASLEFFCRAPLSSNDPPTSGTMDALTILALHVQPRTPSEATEALPKRAELYALRNGAKLADPQLTGSIGLATMRKSVASEIRYLGAEAEGLWSASSTSGSAVLISFMRSTSLLIVPWNQHARSVAEKRTLPRRSRSRGVAASALEYLPPSIGDRINDLQDSAASRVGRDSGELNIGEWSEVISHLDLEITYVLPRFTERAAKLSLGATEDGSHLLELLSEAFAPRPISNALASARSTFSGPWYSSDSESNLRELATQISSYMRQSHHAVDNFTHKRTDLNGLACALGVALSIPGAGSYTLQGFQRGLLDRGRYARNASERVRKVLEPEHEDVEVMRKQVALGQRKFSNRDVEFIGGPWDLPPFSYELASLLPPLYALSIAMSARFHVDVNLRFLASYHAIGTICVALSLAILLLLNA